MEDCSLEELVAVGDVILAAGCTTATQLTLAVAAARRRRGVLRARTALPLLDGRAESPPESVIRVRIIRAGLAVPTPQYVVRTDYGGFVARLDLARPDKRVGAEYDGGYHRAEHQFEADLQRHSRLVAAGWRVLRLTSADLADSDPFLRQWDRLTR